MGTTAYLNDIGSVNVHSDVGGVDTPVGGPLFVGNNVLGADAVTIDGAVFSPGIALRRCKNTLSSPQDVTSADATQLGYIDWRGYSGTKFWQVGSIACHVDGAFTSGQSPPIRMIFAVCDAGGGATEAMRINRRRQVLIGSPALTAIGTNAYLNVKSDLNDWASVVYAAPNSGLGYALRTHTVGTSNSDFPFWASSGADSGTAQFVITGSGRTGIGTSTPVCTLDARGPVRVGVYTKATLPSASAGTGQIIYVSDVTGGPSLAVSDGTNWKQLLLGGNI